MNVISWYDGVVEAVVEREGACAFAFLITWDKRRERKAFALIEVDDPTKNILTELAQRSQEDSAAWTEIRKRIHEICESATGPAKLQVCSELDENITGERAIDAKAIRGLHSPSPEEALSAQRILDWL